MTAQSVCAVIVTHHPSAEMLANLSHVLAQVEGLVVVDNGSNTVELGPLRAASSALGFHLIENGENLGIAEALNQGVCWAKSQGYPWLILFDQDSAITHRFVEQMFAAWRTHPDCERVASIHPRYVDPKTGIEGDVPRANDDSPLFPMTSGSLLPAWIFDKIGSFASEYFIDLVDWEYCFRIRAAGFLVADSRQAKLLHSPGNPSTGHHPGPHFPAHTTQRFEALLHFAKLHCLLSEISLLFPTMGLEGGLLAVARDGNLPDRRREPRPPVSQFPAWNLGWPNRKNGEASGPVRITLNHPVARYLVRMAAAQLNSANYQILRDTVPSRRVTPIIAVQGLPENSWNPGNSRAWQSGPMFKMRDFSLNLA